MNKNFVIWKEVSCKTLDGTYANIGIPQSIDVRNRGTLLSKIFSMKPQTPITFEEAIQMVAAAQLEAFTAGKVANEEGHWHWYNLNFVSWIASQGFHIELTGDEFYSYTLTDLIL